MPRVPSVQRASPVSAASRGPAAYHRHTKDRRVPTETTPEWAGAVGGRPQFAPAFVRGEPNQHAPDTVTPLEQSYTLQFVEIKEATATYYLAPIRFNNEEIMHIDITVQPDYQSKESTFTITKKLYQDRP